MGSARPEAKRNPSTAVKRAIAPNRWAYVRTRKARRVSWSSWATGRAPIGSKLMEGSMGQDRARRLHGFRGGEVKNGQRTDEAGVGRAWTALGGRSSSRSSA